MAQDMDLRSSSLTPKMEIGGIRLELTVRSALEWAFAREFAHLDLHDTGCANDFGGFAGGMEAVLMQRARLGGVRIDTSRGYSRPHDDADAIADIVRSLPGSYGGAWMAMRVANHARAGSVPDWMPGARPRLVPAAWKQGQGVGRYGPRAKTAVAEVILVRHRGRDRRREIPYCPCQWSPSAGKIAAAHANYTDWWWALRWIGRQMSQQSFARVMVRLKLPPSQPWQKTVDDCAHP